MQRFLKTGLVTCLAIIFSLVIYGCGGGGSSGPAAMPPPDDDDDDMAMEPLECDEGKEPNAANDECVYTAETLAAMAVAATKAAATKTTAIKTENDQTTDAGLGGTARSDTDGTTTSADTSDDPYTIAFSRDRDGTTVKITDPDMVADDDPKFTQAMDLDGGRTMHTRTMEAAANGDVVEETVIVTTDIAAPKATEFGKVYDLDARKDGEAVAPNTSPADSLALDSANTDTQAKRDLVMSSRFTSTAAAVLTFTDDDPDTTDMDEAAEFDGTYDGAMGTYRCNGTADCTVTLNAMGKITAMTGTWVFTPNSGVTVDVPDSDYLHYGVWLKKTTDGDGVVEYNEVETFAGSSIPASGDVSLVLGSATYEGGATGVYVHQMLNPAGNVDSATSGHFTADVGVDGAFCSDGG